MIYEGKPTARYRAKTKRTYTGKQRPDRNKTAGIKLLVCVWVLFIAVLIKFVFPTTAEKVQDTALAVLQGSVDYGAAVRTLGEAVSGEKNFFEALAQAYSYAFEISSDDVEVDAPVDIDDSELFYNDPDPIKETVVKEPGEDDVSQNPVETQENVDETQVEEVLGEETIDENEQMVAAFKESQSAYADFELPADVTYEMPELGVECSIPVNGTVTSHFGYRDHPVECEVLFHYGTDIGAARGESVLAFADGTVYAVGDSSSYGLYVILTHDNGVQTLYAHMDSVEVSGGETVSIGDKIGEVGDSGNATGTCLHFELTQNEIYLNPEYYLK